MALVTCNLHESWRVLHNCPTNPIQWWSICRVEILGALQICSPHKIWPFSSRLQIFLPLTKLTEIPREGERSSLPHWLRSVTQTDVDGIFSQVTCCMFAHYSVAQLVQCEKSLRILLFSQNKLRKSAKIL